MASSFTVSASANLKLLSTLNYAAEYSMLLFAAFLLVTGVLGKEQKNRIGDYKGTTDEKSKHASMASTVNTINDVTTYIAVAALAVMVCFYAGKITREGGKFRLNVQGTSVASLSKVQFAAFVTVFAWQIFVLAENIAVHDTVSVWKASDKGCPPPNAVLVNDAGAQKEAKSYYDTFIAFIVISAVFFSLVVASKSVSKFAGGAWSSWSSGSSVRTASSTATPTWRKAGMSYASSGSGVPSYLSKFGYNA